MGKKIVVLDEQEWALVQEHRARAKQDAVQATCEHSWQYDGHSHNDDAYICTKCGAVEFR